MENGRGNVRRCTQCLSTGATPTCFLFAASVKSIRAAVASVTMVCMVIIHSSTDARYMWLTSGLVGNYLLCNVWHVQHGLLCCHATWHKLTPAACERANHSVHWKALRAYWLLRPDDMLAFAVCRSLRLRMWMARPLYVLSLLHYHAWWQDSRMLLMRLNNCTPCKIDFTSKLQSRWGSWANNGILGVEYWPRIEPLTYALQG